MVAEAESETTPRTPPKSPQSAQPDNAADTPMKREMSESSLRPQDDNAETDPEDTLPADPKQLSLEERLARLEEQLQLSAEDRSRGPVRTPYFDDYRA